MPETQVLIGRLRDALADLVERSYKEGSGRQWRLCTMCDTEHHAEDPLGVGDGHDSDCPVRAAELALARELQTRTRHLEAASHASEIRAEAERLLKDITPGEWRYRPYVFDDWGIVRMDGGMPLAKVGCHVPDAEASQHRRDGTDPFAADAQFIAAAPRLVRALLAELDRLREERDAIRAVAEQREDALGDLRGAAEEIAELGQRLYTRMNSGDIPWDAGHDVVGEFEDDFDRLANVIKKAERVLSGRVDRPRLTGDGHRSDQEGA